jgi:hypothetical protein
MTRGSNDSTIDMPLHCSLYEWQFLNFRNSCNGVHLFRAAADFVIVLPYFYDRNKLIICFYCASPKVDSYFNIPICFRNATIALLVSVLLSTFDLELMFYTLLSLGNDVLINAKKTNKFRLLTKQCKFIYDMITTCVAQSTIYISMCHLLKI